MTVRTGSGRRIAWGLEFAGADDADTTGTGLVIARGGRAGAFSPIAFPVEEVTAVFRKFGEASVLAILSAAAFAVAPACSSSSRSEPSPTADDSTFGAIGVALQASGVTFASVSYTITGPGGFSTTGTVDVSSSTQIAATIGGLPAGNGYSITLSATSIDGSETCVGTAPFNVSAGATTAVTIHLACRQPAKSGSVSATGVVNLCPVISSISAAPNQVLTGSSVAVSASAADPDSAPSPLTTQWTSTSGAFASATSAATTFTCAQPGVATLTFTASDGDPACLTTSTVQVTCAGHLDAAAEYPTATKIKHLIVVFGENISFDHYFATYPRVQNNAGEPAFTAAAGTPTANNLVTPLDPTNAFSSVTGVDLVNANGNFTNVGNGTGAANPFRLGPSQAATNDQGHNYKPEQQASDNGAMDLFPEFTGTAGPPPGSPAAATTKGLVMAYYDGNTLGTLWSLAQNFALNDNSWTTTFGPSTPGAINLISGQTNGLLLTNKSPATMSASHVTPDGNGGWTAIGDTDPLGDVCSAAADQNTFAGKNIGDFLNAKNVSWGWFSGGFDLTVTNANGTTGCARATNPTVANFASSSTDYIPHHAPFQYYASTANPTHARPSSVAAIGLSTETDKVTPEPANHQYDSHDFFDALKAGNLPAVTYLKAPAFQDGHAGYSNPTDEGNFVASVVAAVQGAQEWSSTAIVIAYDDSDGWYDHQAPTIVNPSTGVADALNGAGICTKGAQQNGPAPATPLLGNDGNPALGRCGYGTRMPLLVISPYAKKNFIDHTLTDQTSVLRFVEDNWLGGQRIQPGGSFDTIAGTIQNMLDL
jgi:phospholipase C